MGHRTFIEKAVHYFDRPHSGLPQGPVLGRADWFGADVLNHPSRWTVTLAQSDLAEPGTRSPPSPQRAP